MERPARTYGNNTTVIANLGEAAQRLRFPAIAARPAGAALTTVAQETLKSQKLWLEYHARSTDEVTE